MDALRFLAVPRPTLALAMVGASMAVGLGTPWFLDYDEAVYADVARGMWISGDWLRPIANCMPFHEKPVLFYWLVAALYELLGLTPLAPRLVSLLASLVTLLALGRHVARRASGEAAETAVWMAGAAMLPFALGRFGVLDALLTAAMTLALLGFLDGLDEADIFRRRRALAAGYVATGLALAVKGPAFPLLVGGILGVDAVARRHACATLRRSGLLWGAPLALGIGLAPYVLAARAAGPAFLAEFIGEHNLGRALTPMQGHGGSVLYYACFLAAGLMPFTAFLPGALAAIRRHEAGARRLSLFAASWGGVVSLGFSLMATKLPNYLAPAFPALAVLIALHVTRESPRAGRGWLLTVALGSCMAALLAAIPVLLARAPDLLGPWVLERAPELGQLPEATWPYAGFYLAAAILGAGSIAAWRLARRGPVLRAVRALGIAAALAWTALFIATGDLLNAIAIDPLRHLSVVASRELPAGAPIHLAGIYRRVTPTLATGRCTLFLRTRLPADRDHVLQVLARGPAVRMILTDVAWERIRPDAPAREVAREGAYVLVAGGG